MCKNLVEKGKLDKPLLIFNRTKSRADELSAKIGHSTVASSIEEIVSKSDILLYCLGDDASVLEMVDKMLQTSVEGKLLVDCSTIHPDTTEQENQKITAAGGSFVASPVFGAPAMADSGNLVFVLAGETPNVDKVKPYTKDVMGRAIIDYSGASPRKGTLLKIIGNTFILSMVTTLAEGHVVAQTSGLGTDELHKFVRYRSGISFLIDMLTYCIRLRPCSQGPMLRTAHVCCLEIITSVTSREYYTCLHSYSVFIDTIQIDFSPSIWQRRTPGMQKRLPVIPEQECVS